MQMVATLISQIEMLQTLLILGDTVTDTFTYTVDDQSGATDTDTATLTITITGVNDPITAVNDTDAVNEDATINRSTSDYART